MSTTEVIRNEAPVIDGVCVQSTIDSAYDQVHQTLRPSDDLHVDLISVIQKALDRMPPCYERETARAALQLLHDVPYDQVRFATEMGVRFVLDSPNDQHTPGVILNDLYANENVIGFLFGAFPDLDIERFGMDD